MTKVDHSQIGLAMTNHELIEITSYLTGAKNSADQRVAHDVAVTFVDEVWKTLQRAMNTRTHLLNGIFEAWKRDATAAVLAEFRLARALSNPVVRRAWVRCEALAMIECELAQRHAQVLSRLRILRLHAFDMANAEFKSAAQIQDPCQ